MSRHASMPPRLQKTPHGDVTLTSRWQRDRYYLMAFGSAEAVRWMFPKHGGFEVIGGKLRHTFDPAGHPITVERNLRQICARWQESWDHRFQDQATGIEVRPTEEALVITTIQQLFDHLFEIRKGQIASTTQERDRYYLKMWRKHLGEGRTLASLSEKALVDARAALARATTASTANCAMGVLKTYLSWASHQGHMTTSFFRTIKKLKEPASARVRRGWWTADQVEVALQFAAQDPHQPTATLLVACGCFLGLRPEEIIMLRWEDLDLDAVRPATGEPRPVCRVTPHGDWQPKDGEARTIPIPARLLEILRQHRHTKGYLLQAVQVRTKRKEGAVWAYRYDPRKVWLRINAALKAAGHTPIALYGMRHSFASNLLIAGVSDVKVSRWLGHSDTRMLHRHYGHLLSYDEDINAVRYESRPSAPMKDPDSGMPAG